MADSGKKSGAKTSKKVAGKKGDQPDVEGHTTTHKRGATRKRGEQADVQGHIAARNTSRRGDDPSLARSVAAFPGMSGTSSAPGGAGRGGVTCRQPARE